MSSAAWVIPFCLMSTLTFSLPTLDFSSVWSFVSICAVTTFSFNVSSLDLSFVLFLILLLLLVSFPKTLLGPIFWVCWCSPVEYWIRGNRASFRLIRRSFWWRDDYWCTWDFFFWHLFLVIPAALLLEVFSQR